MRARAAHICVAVAVLAIGGCAAAPAIKPEIGTTELADVPFFPQTDYQCGPAALATILAHEGAAVTAAQLVPAVYTEGLRGSLQAELLGATRRQGFVPYVLPADAGAVFTELIAGRPVLVLQNLGVKRVPVWHYAVVVGYDAAAERVILRSGTERRRMEPLRRFLRSFELGGRWAFVALPPGALPAAAAPAAYARAVAGAEPLLDAGAARRAYASGLERWPDEPLMLFTAAAHEHSAARLARAEELYRRLLAVAPADAAARNNLALVLAERGCPVQGLDEARAALELAATDALLGTAIADTIATLEAQVRASRAAASPGCL